MISQNAIDMGNKLVKQQRNNKLVSDLLACFHQGDQENIFDTNHLYHDQFGFRCGYNHKAAAQND